MSAHVDFGHAVDAWVRTLTAGQMGARTIDSYRRTLHSAIDLIGRDVDARMIGIEEWEAAIATWAHLAPNTLHTRLMAIRSFDAWLEVRRGGRGQARHLPSIRRHAPEPRRLTDSEVTRIIAATETPRETAVVRLLAHAALRNHELRSLRVGDVDLDEAILVLEIGKGGHGRTLPLGDATVDALDAHLADLDAQGCADRRHYLVCRRSEALHPVDGGLERRERLEPWKPCGGQAIGRSVQRIAERAGIVEPEAITPHMFRRWSLEAFLASTGDLHAAAALAGHRDVNQTRRYAGRAKAARVRGGVDATESAAKASLTEQRERVARTRRNPSHGRTWFRTRDEGPDSSGTGCDASHPEVDG